VKLYDVAIIEIDSGKIEAIIGKNLNERQADKRIETGLSRINENFYVDSIPAAKYSVGDIVEVQP
jgi:hypothetical protein